MVASWVSVWPSGRSHPSAICERSKNPPSIASPQSLIRSNHTHPLFQEIILQDIVLGVSFKRRSRSVGSQQNLPLIFKLLYYLRLFQKTTHDFSRTCDRLTERFAELRTWTTNLGLRTFGLSKARLGVGVLQGWSVGTWSERNRCDQCTDSPLCLLYFLVIFSRHQCASLPLIFSPYWKKLVDNDFSA